jgi:uncharacterized protein VirK/YbjX
MESPLYAGIVQGDPKFPFRHLKQDYLALGLTASERASCFLHHYSRLNAMLSNNILRQALQGNVLLHEISGKGNSYRITMGLAMESYQEGEMSLFFEAGGAAIFNLGFMIVPGWLVDLEAPDVLMILRLQGEKGCHAQLGLAAKALHDISPAALLVAALQGIAEAIEIRALAGVSATRQSSYTDDCYLSFKRAYDDFFISLETTLEKTGFYYSPLPLHEKPLELVKSNNRLRTKIRRSFKRQVAEDVCRLLRQGDAGKTEGSSCAGLEALETGVLVP